MDLSDEIDTKYYSESSPSGFICYLHTPIILKWNSSDIIYFFNRIIIISGDFYGAYQPGVWKILCLQIIGGMVQWNNHSIYKPHLWIALIRYLIRSKTHISIHILLCVIWTIIVLITLYFIGLSLFLKYNILKCTYKKSF